MRRRHRALTLASVFVGLTSVSASLGACSNVDRDPGAECQDDSDCGTGSICSIAQGNICVAEALPPQAVLGFDIQEGDLRIELLGCDPEISRELGGSVLRVQSRANLVRDVAIRASERRTVQSCGECTGSCEEGVDEQACVEPVDAQLGLSARSRLAIGDLGSPKKNYVTVTEPPLPEGELPPAVGFTWPTYETLDDDSAHAALVLEVSPPAEALTRSRYLRALAEGGPSEFETEALERCERGIIGNEGSVRTMLGNPVAGATVEFIFDESVASPATVVGTSANCQVDEDCLPGWACGPTNRCGLDLRGVSAGSTASVADPPGAFPTAYLYTYCEGVDASEDPLLRKLLVRATPPAELGLPNMIYELDQPFIDPPSPGILTEINIAAPLCFPDWQPPQPVSFSVSGDPVVLAETELGSYACCSTECLPSSDPGVEPTPPPTVESCQSFERVRFETRWFNPDALEWFFAGCTPTAANSDGSSGRFVREVSECAPEGCSASLSTGVVDELSRNYSVSIVQPVGSVFRSQRFNLSIDPETAELPTFELEPRILVEGQIVCVGTDCNAQNAVIAAERLRTDTDDGDLPGPFYFQTRVDATGHYILPLDPGLYVVTAYPAVGQPGGPAPFEILDLSEGSPVVEMVGGVPHAQLDPFELDEGVLVQVQLRDFDVATSVLPIDSGSWAYQSDFPDEYDLNAAQTCLTSSTRGCLIRRIRPTDARISLLITGRFQFTARDRGPNECPG